MLRNLVMNAVNYWGTKVSVTRPADFKKRFGITPDDFGDNLVFEDATNKRWVLKDGYLDAKNALDVKSEHLRIRTPDEFRCMFDLDYKKHWQNEMSRRLDVLKQEIKKASAGAIRTLTLPAPLFMLTSNNQGSWFEFLDRGKKREIWCSKIQRSEQELFLEIRLTQGKKNAKALLVEYDDQKPTVFFFVKPDDSIYVEGVEAILPIAYTQGFVRYAGETERCLIGVAAGFVRRLYISDFNGFDKEDFYQKRIDQPDCFMKVDFIRKTVTYGKTAVFHDV